MSAECTICGKPLTPIDDSLPDNIKQCLKGADRCTACLAKLYIEAEKSGMERFHAGRLSCALNLEERPTW